MRFVERSEEPASLKDPNGIGSKERALAKKHYSKSDVKSYKFKAYKSPDVVEELQSLFKGKCAYCESPYGATAPTDVEHYRPKAGIEEEPNHPGYWWLAASWENLLPSCIDCNRRRRQRIALPEMSLLALAKSKVTKSGKQNSFPIRGTRASHIEDDLSIEEPLLIDPTQRDPSNHLLWQTNIELSVVAPVDNGGVEDIYGLTSIYTFGLNRQRLVEERTKLLQQLKLEAQDIKFLLDLAAEEGNEQSRHKLIGKAIDHINRLRKRTELSAPYSALSIAFNKRLLAGLIDHYSDLLKQDIF